VVKKVTRRLGMVTLQHGALTNIGMSAMTMAYKAKDTAMIDHVKEGDKVKVRVEDVQRHVDYCEVGEALTIGRHRDVAAPTTVSTAVLETAPNRSRLARLRQHFGHGVDAVEWGKP